MGYGRMQKNYQVFRITSIGEASGASQKLLRNDLDLMTQHDGMDRESGNRPFCVIDNEAYWTDPDTQETARMLCAIPGIMEVHFTYQSSGHGHYVTIKPIEEMTETELKECSADFPPGKGVSVRTIMPYKMLEKLAEMMRS
ncbi:MAG: hypothetical protein JW754_04940 [Candidatus Aenigmarchaeota archaeon]|nr:hypothetical protein [Candidatus Aenigmarchaeota archaeon]